MWRVDSFLIDRVFQPIVDALASLVSCYALAAFILTGAGLCFLAFDVHGQQWLGLAMTAIWFPPPLLRAYRLCQERPRAVLPDDRVSGFYARIWFLGLQVTFGPLLIILMLRDKDGGWFLLNEAGWLMLLIGLYLMACRRPPPSERPARRAWFGWLNPLATSAGVR